MSQKYNPQKHPQYSNKNSKKQNLKQKKRNNKTTSSRNKKHDQNRPRNSWVLTRFKSWKKKQKTKNISIKTKSER